jgi:predicted RNA-binding Zn-ribbon protein involved in translation (DUF1610 family)
MSLIKCTECGRDISDKAAACPGCGNPIQEETIQTIQRTSKRWKKYQLVAFAFALLGVYFSLKGIGSNDGGASFGLGIMFYFFAFVIGMIGRIGAWWSNG